jgi:hypothetical protein
VSSANLADRVCDYLKRRTAWSEHLREELDAFKDFSSDDLVVMIVRQSDNEAQSTHLAREHRGLLDEWQRAEDVPESVRIRVRKLADRAEAVTRELLECYEQTQERIQTELAGEQEALNALRRGKDLLTRYRPKNDEDPGFIDKRI